jgi:hypothetical protein
LGVRQKQGRYDNDIQFLLVLVLVPESAIAVMGWSSLLRSLGLWWNISAILLIEGEPVALTTS